MKTIASLFLLAAFLFAIPLQAASANANAGQTVTFSVASDGTPPLSFQWQKNGAPIQGATSQLFLIPSVVAADAGVYTVVVSNPAGSCTSDNATLSVLVKPTSAGTTTTITVTTKVGTVMILSKIPTS